MGHAVDRIGSSIGTKNGCLARSLLLVDGIERGTPSSSFLRRISIPDRLNFMPPDSSKRVPGPRRCRSNDLTQRVYTKIRPRRHTSSSSALLERSLRITSLEGRSRVMVLSDKQARASLAASPDGTDGRRKPTALLVRTVEGSPGVTALLVRTVKGSQGVTTLLVRTVEGSPGVTALLVRTVEGAPEVTTPVVRTVKGFLGVTTPVVRTVKGFPGVTTPVVRPVKRVGHPSRPANRTVKGVGHPSRPSNRTVKGVGHPSRPSNRTVNGVGHLSRPAARGNKPPCIALPPTTQVNTRGKSGICPRAWPLQNRHTGIDEREDTRKGDQP